MNFFGHKGLGGLLGAFKRNQIQGEDRPFDFGEAVLSLFADPEVMAERRRRRMHRESYRLPDGGMGPGIY